MTDIPVGSKEKDAVPTTRGSVVETPIEDEIEDVEQHQSFEGLFVKNEMKSIPRPFAGVDGNFSTKGAIQEKKNLIDKMKKLVPFKYNNDGSPVKITPLTQMYLVRYLGPMLYDNAGQALKKQKVKIEKKASSKREIRKRLQNLIRQVDENDKILASESTLEMDVLFPFTRLKTLIDDPIKPLPDARYGMIQEYYSTLTTEQKKTFKESMLKTVNRIPTTTEDGKILVEERYRKPLLAMFEELGSKTKPTKLSLLDDPSGEKKFSVEQGTTLTTYGLNILLAEEAGRHGLAESALKEYPIEWEEIEEFDGSGYLDQLIVAIYDLDNDDAVFALRNLLTTEYEVIIMNIGTKEIPATAVVLDDDIEIRVGLHLLSGSSQADSIRSIAQMGRQSPANLENKEARVPGCIVLENLVKHMYRIMSSKSVKYNAETKTYDDEMVSFRLEALEATFSATFRDGELQSLNNDGTLSSGNIIFDDGRSGYCTIMSSAGSEESVVDPSEARLFNAFGQVIEIIMLDNAVEAAKGTKQSPSHTRYDETINALIGNSAAIGIATYHAQFHFNLLLNQLQSPFQSMNVTDKDVVGGRLLAVEAYFGDPAKLMLFWMLNFRDYLNWGATAEDGTPQFFQAPLDARTRAEIDAFEKNKLSHLILAYYRLAFAMLTTKEVITGKGKKPKGAADIKDYWRKLLSDAQNDPPPGARFVQMLAFAFGGLGTETRRTDVPYASWMPPPTQTKGMTTKQESSNLIDKYLKWAYGQKPLDISWFAEVAAVYHASKAISISEDYAEMVENFVDAVALDGGHAFLFAILLHEESERNTIPQTPEPIDVRIINVGEKQDLSQVMDTSTPFEAKSKTETETTTKTETKTETKTDTEETDNEEKTFDLADIGPMVDLDNVEQMPEQVQREATEAEETFLNTIAMMALDEDNTVTIRGMFDPDLYDGEISQEFINEVRDAFQQDGSIGIDTVAEKYGVFVDPTNLLEDD